MTISYANEGEYAQKYAGRLEKAHIFDINENGTPIGNINGSSIPVVDAGKYMNQVVLARLKTRLGLRSTLSSFITSHIPKDFESLSPKGLAASAPSQETKALSQSTVELSQVAPDSKAELRAKSEVTFAAEEVSVTSLLVSVTSVVFFVIGVKSVKFFGIG